MSKTRLNILLYHRVLDKYDLLRPSEPDIHWFDKQMRWVKRVFNVLDLADALKKLQANQLPPRAICITFDDGYKDNYQNALPILEKHGLTATFFIATGYLNNGIMWNDIVIECLRNTNSKQLDLRRYNLGCIEIGDNRLKSLNKVINKLKYRPFDERRKVVTDLPAILDVSKPSGQMMTAELVNALHQRGMGIGGHTINHPILSKLDTQQARQELLGGKRILEEIVGDRITLFAYPNGKPGQDYQQEHVDMMKEAGFDAALTTAWGVASEKSDLYQLPRFTPWDKNISKYLLRLARMRYSNMEERV